MRRTPLADLPFWPRYLSREEAARYLGVSATVFDQEVKGGFWPAPRKRGSGEGRLTWDRLLLDARADRESGLDSVPTAPPPDGSALMDQSAVQQAWKARLAKTQKQRSQAG